MKQREFNRLLDTMSTDGLLDPAKMAAASDELRNSVVAHLVRSREPIVLNLIPPSADWSWLSSCGYLYHERGVKFTFLCTSEQQLQVRAQTQRILSGVKQPEPLPFKPGKGQLVGYYPGEGQYGDGTGYAEGAITYNPEAKAHFQKDALAFLRALQKELGWGVHGKKKGPDFNPGGIAGSGDASIVLIPASVGKGVYVTIDAGGTQVPGTRSRSGVVVMWRLCTADRPHGGFGPHLENRFEDWDITAGALAVKIRLAHRRHTGEVTDVELAAARLAG